MLTRIWHNSLLLADGVLARSGPVELPAANLAQVNQYLRALGPHNVDRLSKDYVVSFAITRQHATPLEAAKWRAQQNQLLHNVALLRIEWSLQGDAVELRLTNGAWQRVDCRLIGSVSTTTAYTITGGPAVITLTDAEETPGTLLASESGTPLEIES